MNVFHLVLSKTHKQSSNGLYIGGLIWIFELVVLMVRGLMKLFWELHLDWATILCWWSSLCLKDWNESQKWWASWSNIGGVLGTMGSIVYGCYALNSIKDSGTLWTIGIVVISFWNSPLGNIYKAFIFPFVGSQIEASHVAPFFFKNRVVSPNS